MTELRYDIDRCDIPDTESLKIVSYNEPIICDAVNCFYRGMVQSIEYFNEQKTKTPKKIDGINSYSNILGDNSGTFVNSIVTHGSPVRGR